MIKCCLITTEGCELTKCCFVLDSCWWHLTMFKWLMSQATSTFHVWREHVSISEQLSSCVIFFMRHVWGSPYGQRAAKCVSNSSGRSLLSSQTGLRRCIQIAASKYYPDYYLSMGGYRIVSHKHYKGLGFFFFFDTVIQMSPCIIEQLVMKSTRTVQYDEDQHLDCSRAKKFSHISLTSQVVRWAKRSTCWSVWI